MGEKLREDKRGEGFSRRWNHCFLEKTWQMVEKLGCNWPRASQSLQSSAVRESAMTWVGMNGDEELCPIWKPEGVRIISALCCELFLVIWVPTRLSGKFRSMQSNAMGTVQLKGRLTVCTKGCCRQCELKWFSRDNDLTKKKVYLIPWRSSVNINFKKNII